MPNDFLLDADFDLLVRDGDLVIGESTNQHQALLLLISKGQLKHSPSTGVGAYLWLKADNVAGLLGEVKEQFEADGMAVTSVTITPEGKLNTIANY